MKKGGVSLSQALKRQREDDGHENDRNKKRNPTIDDANSVLATTSSDESVDLVYPFTPNKNGAGGGGAPISLVAEKPLVYTNPNMKIKFRSPLVLDSDDNLTLFMNEPLNVKTNRIDLNYDTRTLSGTPLSVKCETNGGIVVGEEGISVQVDNSSCLAVGGNGMIVRVDGTSINDSNILGVKLNQNGGLKVDGGLAMNISSDFKIENNTLKINIPQFVSPYATYLIGDRILDNFSGQFIDKAGTVSNMAYYFYMVYSAGIVNGIMNFRIRHDNYVPTNKTIQNTIAMNVYGLNRPSTNFSQLVAPTVSPSNMISKFVPVEVNDSFLRVPATGNRWYIGVDKKTTSSVFSFMPFGTSVSFNESKYSYTVVEVFSDNTQLLGINLMISFDMTFTGEWNDSGIQVTTGPLFFSYQGQLL